MNMEETTMTATMSRRQALLAAGAVAGIGATGLRIPAAGAKAALAKDQAPYFYRFMHGKIQATWFRMASYP